MHKIYTPILWTAQQKFGVKIHVYFNKPIIYTYKRDVGYCCTISRRNIRVRTRTLELWIHKKNKLFPAPTTKSRFLITISCVFVMLFSPPSILVNSWRVDLLIRLLVAVVLLLRGTNTFEVGSPLCPDQEPFYGDPCDLDDGV